MSKAKPELKLVEDTGSQLQDEDLSAELPPQQSEMPFAVVEGEPVTQLPRDLYIPPDALQVFLTAFEGPLDLLLYLIRKQNLDILNIPIAEITRQYMKYIDVMAELQLELAGEYLLMAAMLAEIKSRMLLPRPAAAEGTDEDDPRAELVRRLQEYERFKKAAEDLDRLNRLERDNVLASAELEERQVVKLLPDVTLKEMLDAFRDVLSRAEKFAHHHISRERLSQRERMTEILARLQTVAFFEFRQLFKPEEGRMGVTVTFIAILELMKEGLIEIVQAEAYAPIHVRTAQRHLKVVQGGVASETADAENVAALAQPELAGENDIPDEDDTPPADDAAIAVQEAVADVAAASSIAADSIESDHAIANAGFVEAVVSEAIASTEIAVETVAEVAAADEAALAAAVAEEVAAGSPVVIDEAAIESPADPVDAIDAAVIEAAAADLAAEELLLATPAAADIAIDGSLLGEPAAADTAIDGSLLSEPAAIGIAIEGSSLAVDNAVDALTASSHVYDEVTLEDVPHDFGAVDPAVADETDPLAAQAVEHGAQPVAEQVAELGVSPVFDVLSEDAIAQAGLIEGTVSDAPESVATLAAIYTPESVEPPEPVEAAAAAAAVEGVDVVTGDEHTIEEHVVEEHEVEEHVVPEHVVEEHVVPTPVVIEEQALLADTTAFAEAETEFAVDAITQNEPGEIATETLAESEAEAAIDQVETAEVVEAFVVQTERAEIADETVAELEPEVAIDQAETAEVVDAFVTQAEPAEIADEPVVSSDFPAAEVVDEHAQPVATTDVVVTEEAPSIEVAAEHDETTIEQTADLSQSDLSQEDDSVTGASSEADNSDAEPTR